MRLFRKASIKTKLSVLTASAVVAALCLCFAAFILNDVWTLTNAKKRQINALAMVLGTNAVSAIEFHDTEAATRTLSSLYDQPGITGAILYDSCGEVFATFPADLKPEQPWHGDVEQSGFIQVERLIYPPEGTSLSIVGELDQLLADEDISSLPSGSATPSVLAGPVSPGLGKIVIRSDTLDIVSQLRLRIMVTAIILIISLVASLTVSRFFQRAITTPINDLVETTRHITARRDYSMRVETKSQDELGVLCSGFNGMLEEVEESRKELQKAHDELEGRVIERTAELKTAMKEAQAASKAKGDFLANMSHEIRTPMTAIIGYAELLDEEDNISREGQVRIATIQRNGQHLLDIVNDILDISKIEACKMSVERIDCAICEVLADLFSLLRPKATSKGLDLEIEYQGLIPETVHTDPTRLRQILVNLVSNAIKFTRAGHVRVVVSMTDGQNVGSLMQFSVVDTGIGMSPQQLQSVFQAFTQADETMTRRFGGTGLGLTISQRLAKLLGGDISATSTPGQGSAFTATIDVGDLDHVNMIASCREALSSRDSEQLESCIVTPNSNMLEGSILLVEDGVDNQRLIAHLLRKAGAHVEIAENGQIGYELAISAWRDNRAFDLVFMDMQMPVLDGYSTTSRLRVESYPLPIVALTAHAMDEERQKCLDCGCDDFVTKPIDRKTLIKAASKWIVSSRQTKQAGNAPIVEVSTTEAIPSPAS